MMILLRLAEFFCVFVVAKAIYELWANQINAKNGGVYGSVMHSNQHMAALLGIIFYLIFDIWSYIWFEDKADYTSIDFSIYLTNILFSAGLWLVIIDHFKQERTGVTKKSSFFDLFKF